MAVPAKKTSKSKKNQRRAHDAIKAPSLTVCPQCSEPKRPHHVCPKCGYYKGREIITIASED
jgi:large subunit ribosomal protein L32